MNLKKKDNIDHQEKKYKIKNTKYEVKKLKIILMNYQIIYGMMKIKFLN